MKPEKNVMYPILEQIKNRWSGRAFSDTPIPHDKILQIFEAARWAPSSYNAQPWSFIIGKKGDGLFNKMLEALVPSNSLWAENANVLVLAVAEVIKDEKENKYAFYDVGQAVAFLSLEAEALEINVHQMGGFDSKKAEAMFEIPSEKKAVCVLALGYRGSIDTLPEELQKRESSPQMRKPLGDIIRLESE
jgi:nitroreductase